jgi:hypothetical protein
MSKRTEFKFRVHAGDLARSAERLYLHHQDQYDRYKALYDAAVENAEGTVARVVRYPVTGGDRIQLQIDPAVQTRLNHLQQKMTSHENDAKQMKPWVYSFKISDPDVVFELDPDDVLFFDIAGYKAKETLPTVNVETGEED